MSIIKVALGVVLAFVLMIGGCAVIFAAGEGDGSAPADVQDRPDRATEAPRKNVYGDFAIKGKVKVQSDGLGDFSATFRAENVAESESWAMFSIVALKGERIVATMDCAGGGANGIRPGGVTTVECYSTDRYTADYKTIEIEHIG